MSLQNPLHEQSVLHSRRSSQHGMKPTRKHSKPGFGFRMILVHSWVELLYTNFKAGFTETGMMLDPRSPSLLANLQGEKWYFHSLRPSYSEYTLEWNFNDWTRLPGILQEIFVFFFPASSIIRWPRSSRCHRLQSKQPIISHRVGLVVSFFSPRRVFGSWRESQRDGVTVPPLEGMNTCLRDRRRERLKDLRNLLDVFWMLIRGNDMNMPLNVLHGIENMLSLNKYASCPSYA